MDREHAPKHYRWEHLFAEKLFPVMANRDAIMNGTSQRHSHDFMELVLVTSGTGKHLTLYGDEPLYVGRGLILHPGVWHTYHDCDQLVIYNCCFRLELLQHEFFWGQDDTALKALLWPRSPVRDKAVLHRLDLTPEQVILCQNHLESLIALDQQRNTIKVHYLGHFLLFLGTFVHPLQQSGTAGEQKLLHPAVQQSMYLFESNLAFPWTLLEIARQVGLNSSYLVRLFKEHLNTTPMSYLTSKRIEQAASLLVQTTLPINEVGQQVGWLDANHFARRFRAQMGINATQYRALGTQSVTQPDRTHWIG